MKAVCGEDFIYCESHFCFFLLACAQEFRKGLEWRRESCGVSVCVHVLEKNVKNSDPHNRAERSGLGAGARLFPRC